MFSQSYQLPVIDFDKKKNHELISECLRRKALYEI